MSPAYELANYLELNNVGAVSDEDSPWTIYTASEPNEPNECITLFDQGGDEYFQPIDMAAPRVLVRVRSLSYLAAYEKHLEIRAVLAAIAQQDIAQHHYVGVWARTDITSLGSDNNDRFLLTIQYDVIRHAAGATT